MPCGRCRQLLSGRTAAPDLLLCDSVRRDADGEVLPGCLRPRRPGRVTCPASADVVEAPYPYLAPSARQPGRAGTSRRGCP